MTSSALIDEIVSYWLQTNHTQAPTNQQKSVLYQQLWDDLWFGGMRDDEIDKEIKDKFGAVLAEAETGKYDSWYLESDSKSNQAMGALALIILFDQFTRNIYRNKPQSFANDEYARKIARYAIDHGYDKDIIPIGRAFMYLPFLHSENMEDQKTSVQLFTNLESEFGSKIPLIFQRFAKLATTKLKEIETYSRFPKRNAILGRKNTRKEEEDYNFSFLK